MPPCDESHTMPLLPVLLVLVALLPLPPVVVVVAAQNPLGFVNINCGGGLYQNPDTGLIFQGDADFISTGTSAATAASVNVTTDDLKTLRYFPPSSSPTKNCYIVPVENETQYLIRTWFFFGSYTPPPASGSIHFQLALDNTIWRNVSVDAAAAVANVEEAIVITARPSISICLIRTQPGDVPFINSLELRPLSNNSYLHGDYADQPFTVFLSLLDRGNYGELNSTFRYPDDEYDRRWPPVPNQPGWESIFDQDYPGPPLIVAHLDDPPSIIMQSAITNPELLNVTITFHPLIPPRMYFYFFFLEVNGTLPEGSSRLVDIYTNLGEDSTRQQLNLTAKAFVQWGSSDYQALPPDLEVAYFLLSADIYSRYGPIVNAYECYQVLDVEPGSRAGDVTALMSVKTALGLDEWAGDPCFPVPWDQLLCVSGVVTTLNLSGGAFYSLIPSAIGNLTALTTLDLSNNRFFGPLPTWLSMLTSLQYLDVSNNNFSGTFPATYITNLLNFRYDGNEQLSCVPEGHAVCTPANPPLVLGSDAPPNSTATRWETSVKSSVAAPIIGGIAGGAAVILVAACLLLRFCWLKPGSGAAHKSPSSRIAGPALNPGSNRISAPATRGKAQPFSLQVIKDATNNFEKEIGKGGFGPVFYGVLEGNQEVAVKKMSAKSKQGFSEFVNEIDLLSTVHYKKLVSLIGYCQEEMELILLYEYMPGGNLRKHLHGAKAARSPLSWRQRLQIALDAAKGLEYLHHGCQPAIIHRDVKSSNILLSHNLEAKVADFGLSRLKDAGKSHVTTAVKGTLGYLDPEYNTTGILTDKSDVYSFGVVLLEILLGEPPIVSDGPDSQYIVDKVRSAMNTGDLKAVVDPSLKGEFKVESVWSLAEIAISCVTSASSLRPDMIKVVAELTETLQMELGQERGWRQGDENVSISDSFVAMHLNATTDAPDEPSQIFYAHDRPAGR